MSTAGSLMISGTGYDAWEEWGKMVGSPEAGVVSGGCGSCRMEDDGGLRELVTPPDTDLLNVI